MTLLYICGDVLNFLGMQGYHMKSANIDGSKVLDFSSNIPSCSISASNTLWNGVHFFEITKLLKYTTHFLGDPQYCVLL